MRYLFFLLALLIARPSWAVNNTYTRLAVVNRCWLEQKDIDADALPVYVARSEREWIRTHLMLVEATLRKRDMRNLSASQQHNRMQRLDELHAYWQTGNFPVNDLYTYRTPIFIDRYDNFCAVGHLIKTSGNEHISRMIAAKTNLAYVQQMNYPELGTWAADNGFTLDELAWIQPGYGEHTSAYCAKVGNGVDGVVNELFVDKVSEIMYVGGSFSRADADIEARNIAYVTEAAGVYSWHAMGTGVNGPVHAIARFDSKIFVGGSFDTAGGVPVSNVAYWDGVAWHDAGCISGVVYDFTIFNNRLYAGGDLDDCTSLAEVNLARWAFGSWHSIPGIAGKINTMQPFGDDLLFIGGAFSSGGSGNVTTMNGSESVVPSLSWGIENEVMDLEWDAYKKRMYAGCKQTSVSDTNVVFFANPAEGWWAIAPYWAICLGPEEGFLSKEGARSVNTIFSDTTVIDFYGCIYAGGQFEVTENSEEYFFHRYDSPPLHVDSTVNKILKFKDDVILAGKFKTGTSADGVPIVLNGIARRHTIYHPGNVEELNGNTATVNVFPDPASSVSVITIQNNFNANRFLLYDMTGRSLASIGIGSKQQVQLPNLRPGMYMVAVSNDEGQRVIRKIVVE